jgi:hypothetical protein
MPTPAFGGTLVPIAKFQTPAKRRRSSSSLSIRNSATKYRSYLQNGTYRKGSAPPTVAGPQTKPPKSGQPRPDDFDQENSNRSACGNVSATGVNLMLWRQNVKQTAEKIAVPLQLSCLRRIVKPIGGLRIGSVCPFSRGAGVGRSRLKVRRTRLDLCAP